MDEAVGTEVLIPDEPTHRRVRAMAEIVNARRVPTKWATNPDRAHANLGALPFFGEVRHRATPA
jgi:hypothetical protein